MDSERIIMARQIRERLRLDGFEIREIGGKEPLPFKVDESLMAYADGVLTDFGMRQDELSEAEDDAADLREAIEDAIKSLKEALL